MQRRPLYPQGVGTVMVNQEMGARGAAGNHCGTEGCRFSLQLAELRTPRRHAVSRPKKAGHGPASTAASRGLALPVKLSARGGRPGERLRASPCGTAARKRNDELLRGCLGEPPAVATNQATHRTHPIPSGAVLRACESLRPCRSSSPCCACHASFTGGFEKPNSPLRSLRLFASLR